MSRSPERISSYRRHFEDMSSSSASYQVRVSSPSPTRKDARHRSASYSRSGANGASMRAGTMSRRTASSTRQLAAGGRGALCVGFGGEAPIDLDVAAAQNQEFLSTRSGERKEMVILNDRLAVYIEKVRSLEQQNMLLETQIEALQSRFVKPSGLRALYEAQLKELKRIADQTRVHRDLAVAAKEAMAGQLEVIKVRYEEALEQRRKAELNLEAFRPDVDAATSARIVLEKQLEQLEVEIEFLQRVQKQEIEELMAQIYSAHVSAQSAFALPDLSGALKAIQSQYDDIAAKNLQEMDSWYGNKFQDITEKTSKSVDKVRSVRENITSAKKDIQNKERELDALKTRNDALEAEILAAHERHKKELEDLQARVAALQMELKTTKEKMAKLLREYQQLLQIKMSLEIEITTYRKLIEGEDSRLTTMVGNLSLMSSSSMSMSAGMSGGMGGGMGGGLGGGMGGGMGSGVGGGLGGGMAGGIGSGMGGGLGGGVGSGMGSGVGGGLGDAMGGGIGSGMGSGVGGGIKGSVGNGAGGHGGNGHGVNGNGKNGNGGNGKGNGNGFISDQAVEVTERRTVLIRTVKTEEDILETDTQEQTFTIEGAADQEEDEKA